MKKNGSLLFVCLFVIFSGCISCGENDSNEDDLANAEKLGLVKSEENVMNRVKEVLQIPIYPGAKLADFTSNLPEEGTPKEKWEANVMLIVDDPEKVHEFYDEELKLKFEQEEVRSEPDKKLLYNIYNLEFDQELWHYHIYIANDTYTNSPVYEVRMTLKENME